MAYVEKSANAEAARLCFESGELHSVAFQIMRKLQENALVHKDTGDYMKTLKVMETPPGKNGVGDVWALTDDPASYHIEVGHMNPGKGRPGATWVPGLRIVEKTINDIDGKWIEGGYK
jgi:hypothetical protein